MHWRSASNFAHDRRFIGLEVLLAGGRILTADSGGIHPR
jgi:hypothetical protein